MPLSSQDKEYTAYRRNGSPLLPSAARLSAGFSTESIGSDAVTFNDVFNASNAADIAFSLPSDGASLKSVMAKFSSTKAPENRAVSQTASIVAPNDATPHPPAVPGSLAVKSDAIENREPPTETRNQPDRTPTKVAFEENASPVKPKGKFSIFSRKPKADTKSQYRPSHLSVPVSKPDEKDKGVPIPGSAKGDKATNEPAPPFLAAPLSSGSRQNELVGIEPSSATPTAPPTAPPRRDGPIGLAMSGGSLSGRLTGGTDPAAGMDVPSNPSYPPAVTEDVSKENRIVDDSAAGLLSQSAPRGSTVLENRHHDLVGEHYSIETGQGKPGALTAPPSEKSDLGDMPLNDGGAPSGMSVGRDVLADGKAPRGTPANDRRNLIRRSATFDDSRSSPTPDSLDKSQGEGTPHQAMTRGFTSPRSAIVKSSNDPVAVTGSPASPSVAIPLESTPRAGDNFNKSKRPAFLTRRAQDKQAPATEDTSPVPGDLDPAAEFAGLPATFDGAGAGSAGVSSVLRGIAGLNPFTKQPRSKENLSEQSWLREQDSQEEKARQKMAEADQTLTWRQKSLIDKEEAKNKAMLAKISDRNYMATAKDLKVARENLTHQQRRCRELHREEARALNTHTKLSKDHAKLEADLKEAKAAYEALQIRVGELQRLLTAADEDRTSKEQIAEEALTRMQERTREVEAMECNVSKDPPVTVPAVPT